MRGQMALTDSGQIDWRAVERARRVSAINRRQRIRARELALRERAEMRARFAPKLVAWMENGRYFERGA